MRQRLLQSARFARQAARDRGEIQRLNTAIAAASATPCSDQRILLYAAIGSTYSTPTEIFFYHQLTKLGCEVDVRLYDESIPINEVTTLKRELAEGDAFWARSVARGRRFWDGTNTPFSEVSVRSDAVELAGAPDSLDEVLAYLYDGVDLGSIVQASLARYYQTLDFPDDALGNARRMLTTALTNYLEVSELHEQSPYDLMLFSHGIYVSWAPVVEFCRKHDVDFVSYDRGKRLRSITLNKNLPSPIWDLSPVWDDRQERPLTPEKRSAATAYLAERELQKGDVYQYNSGARKGDVRSQLGVSPSAHLITVFTNLIWDAANVQDSTVFPTMIDCVVETVRHFSAKSDTHVILRPHPAERLIGTKQSYATEVRAALGKDVPVNCTILDGDGEINSFSLLDASDVVVVNTSTVGLEAAVLGTPVVVVGSPPYSQKGFTVEPTSVEWYFESLEEPTVPDSEAALRYFALMMLDYQHDVGADLHGLIDICTRIADPRATHFMRDEMIEVNS